MGLGEIWVCAGEGQTGEQIKKVFHEANLFNPLRFIVDGFDFDGFFKSNPSSPALLLIDLGLPNEQAWKILSAVNRKSETALPVVALVDNSTEMLMDRAYEAGVKTYLRKPFNFAEFLGRARLLKMSLMIEKPDEWM